MAKVYDTATDIITFARSSSGTALRRVGYGDELVTDGSHTSIGSDWSYANGVYTSSGAMTASQTIIRFDNIGIEEGKVYSVSLDIANLTAGNVGVKLNGGNIIGFTTNGTHTATLVGLNLNGFQVLEQNGFVGDVSNISVREVIFDRATDPLVLFNHPDDIPRIEYGSDGSLKGLLIEEQRTNLVTYSEDFSNAAWTKQGSTAIDSTLVTGPDGTLSGRRLLNFDSETGDRLIEFVSVSNATLTGSIWVKGEGANVGKDITLVVKRSGGTFVADTVDHTLSSEWVRLDCTFTQLPDNTGVSLVLKHPENGNEASEVLIYGAQLEAGSFATSYIPTSGSQQTRSADVASIPVSAFGYNQDAGTVVVEFDMLSDNAGPTTLTQAAFGFHDGTSNNRLELWSASAGTLTLRDRIAPVNHDTTSSGNSLEQPTKSAASYASGEASKLVVNGGTASVAATATTPPAYSTLLLGDTQNVDAELNGHIKSLKYYPRRLTNTQLQELTA